MFIWPMQCSHINLVMMWRVYLLMWPPFGIYLYHRQGSIFYYIHTMWTVWFKECTFLQENVSHIFTCQDFSFFKKSISLFIFMLLAALGSKGCIQVQQDMDISHPAASTDRKSECSLLNFCLSLDWLFECTCLIRDSVVPDCDSCQLSAASVARHPMLYKNTPAAPQWATHQLTCATFFTVDGLEMTSACWEDVCAAACLLHCY